jgi:plasmid maintenance system antidote protein VapI
VNFLDNKIDSMLKHPWVELQDTIREKWLTQRALASILWKKISEVNELLKWKRNITIQRDYLLHQALWTPIKYRINKQIDYDYSLLNLEELENKINLSETSSKPDQKIEESASDWDENNFKQEENVESDNYPPEIENSQNDDKVDSENWQKNDDEDAKERAKIFRSF